MSDAALFEPHQALAAQLLPIALRDADGAHDLSHLIRVWRNVRAIMAEEGGDADILLAATLLHDAVAVPKDSPDRAAASTRAAKRASTTLHALGWATSRVDPVAHAIAAHSFSAGITPMTTEARVLQDADRLDALGYVGVARCFHVSGQLNRALYNPNDPAAKNRPLDDLAFALDHFATKLLRLQDSFQTTTGARLAKERSAVIAAFRDGLLDEVGG